MFMSKIFITALFMLYMKNIDANSKKFGTSSHHTQTKGASSHHNKGSDKTKGSDYIQIVSKCDKLTHFSCDVGLSCLTWVHKCDYLIDCRDGTDEDDCKYWKKQMPVKMFKVTARTNDAGLLSTVDLKWTVYDDLDTPLVYKIAFQDVSSKYPWKNTTDTWVDYPDVAAAEIRYQSPGHDYAVRLYVKDKTGHEYDKVLEERVRTPDGTPSMPRNLQIEKKGDDLIVFFEEPKLTRGKLRGYNVVMHNNAGKEYVNRVVPPNVPGHVKNVTIGGLPTDLDYYLKVNAFNGVHNGEWNSWSSSLRSMLI